MYNLKNRLMSFCLLSRVLRCGALAVAVVVPSGAAEAVVRSATTVRADLRTGRLVRVEAVAPRPMVPRPVVGRTVAPVVVNSAVPAQAGDLDGLIEDASRRHDVDPMLVHSVIRVESNYNPRAVSPKGAQGLMQLIPATARRFGVSNSFDTKANIEAGVKYLRYLQDAFGDDRLALAAYNAGEGAVMKYGDIPPFAETEAYVQRVGKFYGEAKRRQGAQTAPAPVQPEFRQLQVIRDDAGRYVLRTR
jgi:soluble lytic murein transglycosylase-like protein